MARLACILLGLDPALPGAICPGYNPFTIDTNFKYIGSLPLHVPKSNHWDISIEVFYEAYFDYEIGIF